MKQYTLKLRVWHIPQIPGQPFRVECDSMEEALKIQSVLGQYDIFQLENNIKPDFANMNGIEVWQEDLTDQDLLDMDLDDRWVSCEDQEELDEYLEHLKSLGYEVTTK